MRKLIVAILLFCSSLVVAQSPQWTELDENAKYMVLDTRDDLLMFQFVFVYRDVPNNRLSFSQWYVDCGEGKASLFRHRIVEISSGKITQEQQHAPAWVTFNKDGFGWQVQDRECTKMMERMKNSPTHWKYFTN